MSRHVTSASAPPSTRLSTELTLPIAPNTAIAVLRAGPFGNVVATSATVVGAMIAPAMPCSSRAAMRVPPFWAMPQTAEAMVNSATPTMKARLRPMVSPTRPPTSIRPPKASK